MNYLIGFAVKEVIEEEYKKSGKTIDAFMGDLEDRLLYSANELEEINEFLNESAI